MRESRGVGLPDLTSLTAPWFAADGQGDDGAVSDITPTVWQLGAMQPSDASWGSAPKNAQVSMLPVHIR